MAITNKSPLTVPATAAKEFPHIWLRTIKVLTPSAERGTIEIQSRPYNGETGEIADGPTETISCSAWEAAANVPEVALAMGAIFEAVPALEEWVAAQEEDANLTPDE